MGRIEKKIWREQAAVRKKKQGGSKTKEIKVKRKKTPNIYKEGKKRENSSIKRVWWSKYRMETIFAATGFWPGH